MSTAQAAEATRSTLSIEDVSVGYGRKQVIDRMSAAPLLPGTLTALVGPNGAGKSTLLRSLAGLVPGKGRLRLGTRDLRQLPLSERARHVSFMPQGLPQGVALTVLETLIGALRATPPAGGPVSDEEATRRGIALLERLGIADLALRSLDRLSGGQRQLAGLAQALIREPDVLMLDEPTSALDLRFQLKVMGLVRDTVREHALIGIVVLHDLALAARFSDRVMVLHGGRLRADGSPDETLTPALLAEVYGVRGRVERCSLGHLLVLADEALPQQARA
ncbi:ABC transporter ATP-binding protein [Roseomonas elaeocarpi]|uniref:ABC transporter ATP-binding protein n=1 Tax=Roseomonas elaeocarpi TaxID=907779 RepID=A0ABV6JR90_9PROT